MLLQAVEKGYNGAGICTDEMNWEAMKVGDRIRKLRDFILEAKEKYKLGKKEYEPYADSICRKCRGRSPSERHSSALPKKYSRDEHKAAQRSETSGLADS